MGILVIALMLFVYAAMAGVSSWHTFRSLNLRNIDYLILGVSIVLGIGAGVYSIVLYSELFSIDLDAFGDGILVAIVGVQIVGLMFASFFVRRFLYAKAGLNLSIWDSVKVSLGVLFKFIAMFAILKFAILIGLVILDG